MALRNPDTTAYGSGGALAGDVLGAYLRTQAVAFLRALRLHTEAAGSAPAGGAAAADAAEAARGLRGAARRIAGSLTTFRAVTDSAWADGLRGELAWLSSVLADEHTSAALPARLLDALHRLSGSPDRPGGAAGGGLAAGPLRAAALLERQLAPARARAHAAALQAMGSSRFHAVVDAVAVLASEVPLDPVAARGPVADVLVPLAAVPRARLEAAVAALPRPAQAPPYDAGQDGSWHEVRHLLRIHRYAREALGEDVARPAEAGGALARQGDAAEAAAASAAAARTPRIAPATAYALGVLHADQRHEAEAARRAFHRIWHPAPTPA
ncbi:CHAD domain-containing protein [Streptomyces globosus]|uniref:CHAD domain-containing protein n=1 Tax=Streptomyces globosus TaxID=68209 RepID=UPI001FE88780|nr:CHAD domain-containing protein [Streptomyces globosus]